MKQILSPLKLPSPLVPFFFPLLFFETEPTAVLLLPFPPQFVEGTATGEVRFSHHSPVILRRGAGGLRRGLGGFWRGRKHAVSTVCPRAIEPKEPPHPLNPKPPVGPCLRYVSVLNFRRRYANRGGVINRGVTGIMQIARARDGAQKERASANLCRHSAGGR